MPFLLLAQIWDETEMNEAILEEVTNVWEMKNDKNHLIGVRIIYTIILHIFIIQHLLFPKSVFPLLYVKFLFKF